MRFLVPCLIYSSLYLPTFMRKLILFVAACIISVNAFSQSFHHGIGVSIFFDNMTPDKITAISAITYSPRYNFRETEKMSASLGIPLSIGFVGDGNNTVYYDEVTGEETSGSIKGFAVNLPLVVNLNVGAGSTKGNKHNIGGFIGAGYTWHYVSSRDYTKDGNDKTIGGSSFGPTINGGFRFNLGGDPVDNIELRFSYYKGSNRTRLEMFGIGAIFNF